MTEKYIMDAHAWIEYLTATKAGTKIKTILEENNEIYTCAITVAEGISKTAREKRNPEPVHETLTTNSQIINADDQNKNIKRRPTLQRHQRSHLNNKLLAVACCLCMIFVL